MGYTNYVFEDLEFTDYDYKYIMCVRFPNWNQTSFDYGDIGYVTVSYVREGIDTWYDGKEFIPYKYTNLVFLKFIHEKPEISVSEIKLD
jgi:hypothetical protein